MALFARDEGLVGHEAHVIAAEERNGVSGSGGSSADSFHRLRELEARAGVFNGDELLAERVALSAQLAPLDAVVGPAGIGDAQLKALRYGIAAEVRAEAQLAGLKTTEAAIEEKALSDPRYLQKLHDMLELRTEYVILRSLIDNLTSRMQWAMAVMRYAANEPRNI
jgi:hypothetical protein